MTCLLQISDPHFGTEQDHVMRALLQLIEECQPDAVLLSGDVTQRARRNQFAAAQKFIDQLPCPLLAVPGNHDIPLFNLAARFTNPYGNYKRVFGDDLEPEFENDDVLVIGVNTTRLPDTRMARCHRVRSPTSSSACARHGRSSCG